MLTTQAQRPSTLTTPAGLEFEVLEQTKTHKWLGYLLSTLKVKVKVKPARQMASPFYGAGTNVRTNCYLPTANCTNSSIDCSHKAGLRTATFCQLSHRFHLVDSSIFVTHVFGLLPSLLSTLNMGKRQQDMNYRLQNAVRAFQANKWILCDKNVSIALRLKFFDAMVTSVVCFAAGHRKVYVGE